MRVHKIKIKYQYADRVFDGSKTFEIRYNDRDYQTGDILEFTVVGDDTKPIEHELNGKRYVVNYVFPLDRMGFSPINHVVMSIKPCNCDYVVRGWCLVDDGTTYKGEHDGNTKG